VEHHPDGLTTDFHAISSAFMVSLLSGENDMAQPTGFLANRSRITAVRPALTRPDIGHITAPHLIWFRYGELSLKMIRDNVLMTATLIPVSRLLATDQPQLFHESASKPAPHLEPLSLPMWRCFVPAKPWLMPAVQVPGCVRQEVCVWLFRTVFQHLAATAAFEHMARVATG
jgi:hypothetical protein